MGRRSFAFVWGLAFLLTQMLIGAPMRETAAMPMPDIASVGSGGANRQAASQEQAYLANPAAIQPGRREASTSGGPLGQRFPISPVHLSDGRESYPSVAYNSQWQEYLVVWQGDDIPGQVNIYGQFVSHRGALIGSRFLIPAFVGINARPDVAYNPARNEYLVVFDRGDGTAGLWGIHGMRLDAYGTPVGAQFTFVYSTMVSYLAPAVAYSTQSGQYLVVWFRDQRVSPTQWGIEARTLSGDGSTLGPILEITGLQEYLQPGWPDVAYGRAWDEFLVVWDQYRDSATTDHDIMGQRIGMYGGAHLEGPNFPIHNTADEEAAAAVAWVSQPSGTGDYLVTCSREYGGLRYVAGQLVTDDGTLHYYYTWISPSNSADPIRVSAVAGNENTHEFLVAWRYGAAIQARTVTNGGVLGPYAESQPYGLDPDLPAIAGGPLGDYLVAYHDQYYTGYPYDVFGFLWGNRVFLPLGVRH